MPLYDPLGFISDKQCVVLDIGSRYTKFGFSDEDSPRCIIKTPSLTTGISETRHIYERIDKHELRTILVDFIRVLFFRYALINPKEKRVVVVECLLCTTMFRETLSSVLFDDYEVASVLYLPSHVVSLYTLAINTGLVVDIGQQETVIIPVCEGIPVLKACHTTPFSSNAVESELRNILTKKLDQAGLENSVTLLSNNVVEDIKIKGCFVTSLERAKLLSERKTPVPQPPGFTYRLNGEKKIYIDSLDRETPYEILFQKDDDENSLPSMILDSILQCPIDTRRPLSENIVLTGGTTMTVGFKARLQQELNSILNTPRYQNKLFISTFKFHQPPAKENYVAWLGGSICGATATILTKSVTREAYVEMNSHVPDWPDIRQKI